MRSRQFLKNDQVKESKKITADITKNSISDNGWRKFPFVVLRGSFMCEKCFVKRSDRSTDPEVSIIFFKLRPKSPEFKAFTR